MKISGGLPQVSLGGGETYIDKGVKPRGKHTRLYIPVSIHGVLECSQQSFFDDLEKIS